MRKIYLLSPKEYSAETIAVAFAKTSRSPQSFKENADALTESSSAAFNEKWVLGFGHNSVAEAAIIHIAIEGVSRMVVEIIESCRLASYTEKSSRYQTYGSDSFYIPEFSDPKMRVEYLSLMNDLMALYGKSLVEIKKLVSEDNPRKEEETDDQYDSRLRSKYADQARYALPQSALANVGVTINARELALLIRKLLASHIKEANDVGAEILSFAKQELPSLLKYADEGLGYLDTFDSFVPDNKVDATTYHNVSLANMDRFDDLARIGCLRENLSIRDIDSWLATASKEDIEGKILKLADGRGEHDQLPREYEWFSISFDIVADNGALYELKRHRMMTYLPQMLTARMGWRVPKMFYDAGLVPEYNEMMERVSLFYETLALTVPAIAGYIIPNAFLRRAYVKMNLRQLTAICELRSKPKAHAAMRVIAYQMYEAITARHPFLAHLIRVPVTDDAHNMSVKINSEFFSQ